jgi:hypothetical protein
MSRTRQADFSAIVLCFGSVKRCVCFPLGTDPHVTSSGRVHVPDEMAQKSAGVGWNFSCWLLGFLQVEA